MTTPEWQNPGSSENRKRFKSEDVAGLCCIPNLSACKVGREGEEGAMAMAGDDQRSSPNLLQSPLGTDW